jgi:hypothetical protein
MSVMSLDSKYQNRDYQNLNFGTKPTSALLETIVVQIDSELILKDFAKAYADELSRRNPTRAREVGLTEQELKDYFDGILAIRIESVEGYSPVWRQAKQLYIPSWIQFVISRVGEVIDTDRGLKIVPKFAGKYDFDSLLVTSNRLRAFLSDGLALHKDAFPREREGDKDTMTMAIINGYVCGQVATTHPISSYVAAFLGFKLREEIAFKMLYRVRYDDIKYIQAMILAEESLL